MIQSYAERLRIVFADGLSYGRKAVRTREVAQLRLVSGKIVACDPFVYLDRAAPFKRRAPIGSFPVVLTHFVDLTRKDPLARAGVEFASVRFSDRAPVRWEPAVCEGEPDGEVRAYPVDAGAGCYVDRAAAEVAQGEMDLLERARDSGLYDQSFASVVLDPKRGANIVVFKSGAGDGAYPCFWGFDDQGNLAALVTDFAGDLANQLAEGGPVPEGDAEITLGALHSFITDVGRPSEAWEKRFLVEGGMEVLWARCSNAYELLSALLDVQHPDASAAVCGYLGACESFCESSGQSSAAESLRKLHMALRLGEVDASQAHSSGLRAFGEAFDRIHPRRPPHPIGERVAALREGKTLSDPNAGRRAAERELDARMAALVRQLAPNPPSFSAFVEGATSAQNERLARARR